MTQRADKLNAILAVQATAHRLTTLLLRAMNAPTPPRPEPAIERVLESHAGSVDHALHLICTRSPFSNASPACASAKPKRRH